MKKRLFLLFFTLIVLFGISKSVYADTAPKPSFDINITGLDENKSYMAGIILNESSRYGRICVNNDEILGATINEDGKYCIIRDSYELEVMCYEELLLISSKITLSENEWFLDSVMTINDSKEATYGYHYFAPYEFRFYIYCVDDDTFELTDLISREYFFSMIDYEYGTGSYVLKEQNTKFYAKEILIRLLLTLSVECLIAFFFKFSKKSYIVIVLANIITQILLDISMLYLSTEFFSEYLIIILIFFEILIAIVEAFIYKIFTKRNKDQKNFIVLYAIVANLASFLIGLTNIVEMLQMFK